MFAPVRALKRNDYRVTRWNGHRVTLFYVDPCQLVSRLPDSSHLAIVNQRAGEYGTNQGLNLGAGPPAVAP